MFYCFVFLWKPHKTGSISLLIKKKWSTNRLNNFPNVIHQNKREGDVFQASQHKLSPITVNKLMKSLDK